MVNGRTATLVIEGYTDSADAGVYSCLVESDYFGKSIELKDIEQSLYEVMPPTMGLWISLFIYLFRPMR